MGEPTISEEVVEAAMGVVPERLRQPDGCTVSLLPEDWEALFRAALTAAEPLMHEGCRDARLVTEHADALDRAEAENARLREAGEKLRRNMDLALEYLQVLEDATGEPHLSYNCRLCGAAKDDEHRPGCQVLVMSARVDAARAALAPTTPEPGEEGASDG